MTIWKNDKELFRIAKRELFVALVGDILDTMGFQRQFLPPKIKPIQNDFVVIGRAMTVVDADVSEKEAEGPKIQYLKNPLELCLKLWMISKKRKCIFVPVHLQPTLSEEV